jgi:hypothetical protein
VSEVRRATGQSGDLAFSLELLAELVVVQGEALELRKVELGSCARPYGTPCKHEHTCIRCPMLRVDPAQRDRLAEITRNLAERITEARLAGWLGEVRGLQVSLHAARDKLTALDRLRGRDQTPRTALGIPEVRRSVPGFGTGSDTR